MAPLETIRTGYAVPRIEQIAEIFNNAYEKNGWRPLGFGNDEHGLFLLIYREPSMPLGRPELTGPKSISVVEPREGKTIVLEEEQILRVKEALARLFFYPNSRKGPALDYHYRQALYGGKNDDLIFLFPRPYNDKMSRFYATLRRADIRSIPDLLNLTTEEAGQIKYIGDKGIVAINTIRNILSLE